jgi:2Fe-2S ferredoxin
MRVGQANFIPTIRGECGGTCSCGSCHVYVDPEWLPNSSRRMSWSR